MRRERPEPAWEDYALLAALTAGALAFQLLLLRILAFSQWNHFASLAVALALLGFGAAGTALALLGERARRWGDWLFAGAALAAVAGILLVYEVNLRINVRPLFAVWDTRESLKLLLLNFSGFLPFFAAGLAIGQPFCRWPAAARRLYAANLLGSGLGCLAIPPLLRFAAPSQAILWTALFLLAAVGMVLTRRRLRLAGGAALAGAMALGVAMARAPSPALFLSDYKRLANLLALPEARILRRENDPRALLTEIRSDHLRVANGLSLTWRKEIPAADALVLDADRAIFLPREAASLRRDFDYLGATLAALPFELRPAGRALICGTGESPSVLLAARREEGEAVWVERNPRIPEAVARRGLLPARVRTQIESPRAFLERAPAEFDLIVFDSTADGADALQEESLLTIEGLGAALRALGSGGALAIALPASNPPRHLRKLMRMARQALGARGAQTPSRQILAARSMRQMILCLFAAPVSERDLEIFHNFCDRLEFDPVCAPGLEEERSNRFHRLDTAVYFHEALRALGEDAAAPRDASAGARSWFQTAPPVDDRPYFWYSMRWGAAREILRGAGRSGVTLLDWGPLLLAVALAVAAPLAALLLLAPLGCAPRAAPPLRRRSIFGYFAALGMGYFFFEMTAFQRALLLFGDPATCAAFVFGLFLLGSAAGSFGAPSAGERTCVWKIFPALLIAAAFAWFVLGSGLNSLWRAPGWLQWAGCAVAIAPLAWALGRPMPWGLRRLGASPGLIPWAWGINAFASVIAAPLATLLALERGHRALWVLGAFFYLAALGIALRWTSPRRAE